MSIQKKRVKAKTVAIVGGGVAGLAAARDLAALGHRVVVFDKHERPGGMLVQGIPTFRLPRDVIDRDVERVDRIVELVVVQRHVYRLVHVNILRPAIDRSAPASVEVRKVSPGHGTEERIVGPVTIGAFVDRKIHQGVAKRAWIAEHTQAGKSIHGQVHGFRRGCGEQQGRCTK